MDTLRSLRLWHWKRVLSYRAAAERHEARIRRFQQLNPDRPVRYDLAQVRSNHREANRHLGAVQALNDVVSGTAEEDMRHGLSG